MTPDLEAKIRSEIAEIERRIAELVAERDSLRRVLTRVHNEKLGGQRDARRNSYDRLLIENSILETLRAAKAKPVSTRELLKEARLSSPHLKGVTFRSYLHRLKTRGLVLQVERMYAHWMLPENSNVVFLATSEKP